MVIKVKQNYIMKNKIKLLASLIIGATAFSHAQTARVQAIHNCPDPAAAVVDIWIDNTKLIDDMAYKDASAYINAPTGTPFRLSVCPSTSVDTMSAIFKKTFTLPAGAVATVVAQGGLAQTGSTAFDLVAFSGKKQPL